MTIKQIVADRLRQDGFDGLCCEACGCRLADLMPCDEPDIEECRPGHVRYGTFEGVKRTWIIEESKGTP
jgi:hypothetical protein